LLKLKKLQILGFKSFCDRTELRFHGDGIAAIVGPNGCGKSNISDAITWVLGEQSAKSLRGTRMEDVIFNGTRDRKPTGMAEVSLTLIDPQVYDGDDKDDDPVIEIRDDMPEDDWDEESVRTQAAEETEAATAEAQPGQREEVAAAEGQAPQTAPAPDAQPAETQGEAKHSAVVLKIRRRKFKTMPLKAGEIVVTRRLFRSGESEYLLNRKLCRLRDIQDIFMGTGLGPESYAIIEQGRIGQILSSKPTDRRAIIEEAAGITKFKTKKRLAEARLEEAKQNLNRINDIFEEVTRQMNSLKRQAAKAARYATLRDEMREKLRLVIASKWTQLQSEQRELSAELESISTVLAEKAEAVRMLEQEHGECANRGYEIGGEAQRVRERLNTIAIESDRAASKVRQNEERCAELEQRSAAAQQELEGTTAKLHELQQEVELNRATVESAASDVANAHRDLSERQAAANQASQTLAALERQQEQRRVAVMQAANEVAGIRNRITQAEENLFSLDRESQRLRNEIESASVQLENFGGERGQLGLEFESASKRVESLAAQITDIRQQLGAKRQEEITSKKTLDGLRSEYATALGKKSSLEAVIAEHGYSTESVRRLFQSGALQGGHAPVGVLADFLEVEDRFEHVVDEFLRDELNYVVVKSWDAANEGLNLLRTDVEGRATFLVHPEDSQAKFPFIADESAQFTPRHEGVVPLKNCIRVLDGFGKSLEVILPKLGNGYIVPSAEIGRELALENPDSFFLASTGECFHNVTVTGGKQRAEGPLAMKRELRDLLRHMSELERALGEEERRVGTIGKEIVEFTHLVDRLEGDRREAEKQSVTSGTALKQLDTEMARVRQRVETYERELTRVSGERSAREALIAEKRAELEMSEARRAELEQAIASDQEQLAQLRTARDAAAQNASEARASVAALEERRRAAQQALQRIEVLVNEVAARMRQLQNQIDGAANERRLREEENVRIAEQLQAFATEREQVQSRESELQAEAERIRARISELDEQLKSLRGELDTARDRRGEVAAVCAKLESDAAYMTDTSVNELGLRPEELLADGTLQPVEGEQLAVEEEAYREMRTRLDAFGAVNMMALEEFNEVSQRHATLETQRKDLFDAIEDTQATIKEIEVISKQKFQEAFEVINANFSHTFTKLFGGGQAFMKLTDEENAMESGIDVVASPPGKKLQNVLLLSGGEKALTALSLLVGIFQYQPSPFCILDEVDAPLDEANIGRFTELIREMSVQTQFIIITHSKKTMSSAPVMYGVTMQEPGVSKVVSVRFHDGTTTQAATA